jgi:predicted RNase H-like HicB family nuclease
MHVMKERFTAVVEPVDEGGFRAHCPEVAGANGQGDTAEEAEASLHDAIQLVLESRTLDEARWVYEAALQGIASAKNIVSWADEKIMVIDKPPYWLIELSTLKSGDPPAYSRAIEAQVLRPLTLKEKVGLIAAAYDGATLSLENALGLLHELGCSNDPEEDLPDPIWELLVEWDHEPDTGGDLEVRFRAALAEHLQTLPEKPFLITPLSPC